MATLKRQNSLYNDMTGCEIRNNYRGWSFFILNLDNLKTTSNILSVNITDEKVIFQTLRDMDFSFITKEDFEYEFGLIGFKRHEYESNSNLHSRFRRFISKNDDKSISRLFAENSDKIKLINVFSFSVEQFADKYELCKSGKLSYGRLEMDEFSLSFNNYCEDDVFRWFVSLPIIKINRERLNTFF